MDIEIKKRKRKENTFHLPYTIPVSETMKTQLDRLKVQENIDVNAMTRDFFQHLLNRTLGDERQQENQI